MYSRRVTCLKCGTFSWFQSKRKRKWSEKKDGTTPNGKLLLGCHICGYLVWASYVMVAPLNVDRRIIQENLKSAAFDEYTEGLEILIFDNAPPPNATQQITQADVAVATSENGEGKNRHAA